jgi:transcriptional regulator of heat shock response
LIDDNKDEEDVVYMSKNILSEEVKDKRRILYAEFRERYLMEVWNGEENEISDTLDFYEESVVHYGEGVDVGFTFLIDELTNYGEEGLIATIKDIVRMKQ